MPWTDGLDEATLGHAGLNNWKPDSNPEEVARAAVQAHLAAQKIIQAPAGEYLRIPKDANDTDGWGKVHAALGAAQDPKEYVFDAVKFKDGAAIDDTLAATLRDMAAELHLRPDDAQRLAARIIKLTDDAEAADAGNRSAARASEDIQLRQSWGGNYELFKANADRAAALLGLTPAFIDGLAGSGLGYVGTYETLRGLADRLGESKLIGSGTGERTDGLKPMPGEEALARHAELMGDQAWVKRYFAGDQEARAMMNHLNSIIADWRVGGGRYNVQR